MYLFRNFKMSEEFSISNIEKHFALCAENKNVRKVFK